MRFRAEQYDNVLRALVIGRDTEDLVLAPCPNMLVPWYLMAAYAYEELDAPFLSDSGFDWCCQMLAEKWDEITHHHKHLIDKSSLGTSTGSYLVGKIPIRVQYAARHMLHGYTSLERILENAKPAPKPSVSIDDLLYGDAPKPKPKPSIDDLISGKPAVSLEGLL